MRSAQVALVSELTNNEISPSELEQCAAALQQQAYHGLGPAWHLLATVQSYADESSVPSGYWKMVIKEQLDDPGALGYHTDENNQPISYIMYTSSWSITASHEFVEMLGDPWGNRLYRAPSVEPGVHHMVSYLLELGDPVEAEQFAYAVDGVPLSDFILHEFGNGHKGPWDQMDHCTGPRQILDGGYISWVEPDGTWKQLTNFGSVQVNTLGRADSRPAEQSLREWVDSHENGATRKLRQEAINGA